MWDEIALLILNLFIRKKKDVAKQTQGFIREIANPVNNKALY